MPALNNPKRRLGYIDWMRGLACLLMFQTHCYDSWLGGSARTGHFYMYSQLGGTFPAPLFLFLAGMSFALVTEKLVEKRLSASQIARTTIWRGAEIFGFGVLFRMQEYIVAWGWAPKSDLLRVDVLNTIGASMMLMGVMCWFVNRITSALALTKNSEPSTGDPSDRGHVSNRRELILVAVGVALTISLFSPLLWTIWRPLWLPWPLESYVDGVHNIGTPQAGLFPLFPWAGFAFTGLATGFLFQSKWARAREARVVIGAGLVGLALIQLSRWLDAQSWQVYPVYDYWHTSPEFFVIRVGMLLVILTASYAWCRWGAGERGFSPLVLLGQASLLVYWVHIEFVYGRVSILPKRAESIGMASVGLLIIFLAMLGLAYIRTHWNGWMKDRLPSPSRVDARTLQPRSGGM
jgi:uncharacterized membrane protein